MPMSHQVSRLAAHQFHSQLLRVPLGVPGPLRGVCEGGLHVNGHIGMELVEENGVVVEGVARHRRPQGQLPAEIILAGRGHRLHGLHGVLRRLPLSLRQGRAVNGLLVCVAAGEESEQEAKYKKHAYEFFHDNPPSIGGGPPSRNGSANTPRASITWRRWYNSNQM